MSKRDLTKCSREGRRWIKEVMKFYVLGFISDSDYRQMQTQLADIVSAERAVALRARGYRRKDGA